MATEGVSSAVGVPGPQLRCSSPTRPTRGTVFFTLEPLRASASAPRPKSPAELDGQVLRAAGRVRLRHHAAADSRASAPARAIRCMCRTARALGYGELQNAVRRAGRGDLRRCRACSFPISSYQANVPQLDAVVDRTKAKAHGVAMTDAVRDAAGVSGLDVRQRLQPLRAHLPGDRAGRCRRSATKSKTSRACARATSRPDGADRQHGVRSGRPTAPIR